MSLLSHNSREEIMNEQNVESYNNGGLIITSNIKGAHYYSKASYPVRYGRYSQIETPDYIFQFNLNG